MIKRIRNTILYAAVLSVCWLLFGLLHSYFFLVALLFFGSLFLYDIILLKKIKNNVKIVICNPKNAITKGILQHILVSVENPTIFFTPNLYFTLEFNNEFYGEKAEYTWNIPLYARGVRQLELPIRFQRSGKMIISIKEIRISGILGILTTKQKSDGQGMFYVYPAMLERSMEVGEYEGLKEEDKTGRQEGIMQGNHFSEVSGIREYIQGDSIRDIHWKLSAKKEKLMVKEHVILSDTTQTLLVELADVVYEQERCIEAELELLLRFLQEHVNRQIPFEIVWWNCRQGQMEHLTVNRTEQIFTSLEGMMEAGMYPDNFLLEQRWIRDNIRGEGYLWIGMDQDVAKEQIAAEGNCKTIVRTGR